MAALVSDVDIDEHLHQSGPSDFPAEEVSSSTTPPAKKKFKSYDAKFKLSVIAFAETHSNGKASRKYGVGESSVYENSWPGLW